MKAIIALALFMLLGFGHCGTPAKKDPLVGKYTLQAHDAVGKQIFAGTLSIDTFENGRIKGLCKLETVAPSLMFGKNGPWEGEVHGDEILMDLAPRLDDAGVTLEGHWREGHISGTVKTESYAGSRTVGTFDAIRN